MNKPLLECGARTEACGRVVWSGRRVWRHVCVANCLWHLSRRRSMRERDVFPSQGAVLSRSRRGSSGGVGACWKLLTKVAVLRSRCRCHFEKTMLSTYCTSLYFCGCHWCTRYDHYRKCSHNISLDVCDTLLRESDEINYYYWRYRPDYDMFIVLVKLHRRRTVDMLMRHLLLQGVTWPFVTVLVTFRMTRLRGVSERTEPFDVQ